MHGPPIAPDFEFELNLVCILNWRFILLGSCRIVDFWFFYVGGPLVTIRYGSRLHLCRIVGKNSSAKAVALTLYSQLQLVRHGRKTATFLELYACGLVGWDGICCSVLYGFPFLSFPMTPPKVLKTVYFN